MRLVATNAPDRGECFSDPGREHLIETLKGETVRLEESGTDQFDRSLAHVFVGERHVNLEMVSLGLSLASTPTGDDPYRDRILTAEQEAYESGAGLWAPDACGDHDELPSLAIDPEGSEPDPPGPDEEYLGEETLVIVNESRATIDLGGWILRDESTRHRYTFPSGASIEPGELVITSAAGGWVPGDSPVWNNGGDLALLQLPDGTVISRWRY